MAQSTPSGSSSFFSTDDAVLSPLEKEWSDITLLHESSKGWCGVYSCLHNGRRIAVKTLLPQYRDSDIHNRMLRKEYETGAGLNHENIISVMGMEEIPGLGPAIIMEYVEGISLADFLGSRQKLDMETTDRLITQLCSALSYLHSRQIIHCDLKPTNILVNTYGEYLRIIDFGLSRGYGYESLDFAGGTEGFSAPEAMASGTSITYKADIYSVGAILKTLAAAAGDKAISSVADRCMAVNPDGRPARADLIPLLLHKARRNRRLQILLALLLPLSAILLAMAIYVNRPPAATAWNTTVNIIPSFPVAPYQQSLPLSPGDSISDAGSRQDQEQTLPEVPFTSALPSPAGTTLPFDEQLYRYARQCAAARFSDHLTLLDTMTTLRSNQLTLIHHWRWLAREDVRRWLETNLSAANPRIEAYLADAARTIENYGNEDEQIAADTSHRRNAIRRDPNLAGAPTAYTYPLGEDRICRESLEEDGTWSKTVTSTKRTATP